MNYIEERKRRYEDEYGQGIQASINKRIEHELQLKICNLEDELKMIYNQLNYYKSLSEL